MTKEVIRIVSPIKQASLASKKDDDKDHDLNIHVPNIKINSQHEQLDLVKKARRIFQWVSSLSKRYSYQNLDFDLLFNKTH